VEIPKDNGKAVRLLGVPNTEDRVAQTAAAMLLEARLERVFHRDSYGYRPGRARMTRWPRAAGGAGNTTGERRDKPA
jgi:RNA-directed DNA polymerase